VKISGSYTLAVPRQQVWDALQDPAVLARTLPGCESLEVTGPDRYAATVTAGVASVKGTYRGSVHLTDKEAPSAYRFSASGAGAPGTIRADASIRLADDGGATTVHYEADAVIGGMIGGVGQRMLSGVAKKTAADFFAAVERDLVEGPVEAPAAVAAPEVAPAEPQRAEVQVGQVFRASATRPAGPSEGRRFAELAGAALVGALIALLGVLVGRRTVRD
jgi:uncharacterized protein